MSSLESPSEVEIVSGNIGTQTALTLIGALSGNPLAALLPVLSSSLASERHKRRVENALNNIDAILRRHERELKELSDSQYKILNEAILAILQTTNDEKIKYLKNAIQNSLKKDEYSPQEAVNLGRIVRDISAEEAEFLLKNFQYDRVEVSKSKSDSEKNIRNVEPESSEEVVVTGLVSLGLLIDAGPTYDDAGRLRFSSLVVKLLVLLQD